MKEPPHKGDPEWCIWAVKRIAELEHTVGVCAGDYKTAHLRIAELAAMLVTAEAVESGLRADVEQQADSIDILRKRLAEQVAEIADLKNKVLQADDRRELVTNTNKEILLTVASQAAEIAGLKAIIAAAPHSDSCCLEYVTVGAVDRDETRPYCNCWKSKAGE